MRHPWSSGLLRRLVLSNVDSFESSLNFTQVHLRMAQSSFGAFEYTAHVLGNDEWLQSRKRHLLGSRSVSAAFVKMLSAASAISLVCYNCSAYCSFCLRSFGFPAGIGQSMLQVLQAVSLIVHHYLLHQQKSWILVRIRPSCVLSVGALVIEHRQRR